VIVELEAGVTLIAIANAVKLQFCYSAAIEIHTLDQATTGFSPSLCTNTIASKSTGVTAVVAGTADGVEQGERTNTRADPDADFRAQ
jgi:hypothetical protein